MTTREIAQLGYIGISVSDVPKWTSFATEVLGMQIAIATEGLVRLRMDQYASRIDVMQGSDDDLLYAGWQVAGRRELKELKLRVSGQGVEVVDATDAELKARGVQGMAWFLDPDGLRTEIAFGLTQASDPIIYGRPLSGFKAGEQGVGHIVVRVENRDVAEAFYTDVLGFAVSDYGSGRLAFLNCNARHHSIAFAPRSIIPGDKRLIHIMIETTSIDDVGTAIDISERLGYFIPETLGRHTNDGMLSFYIESPSGFQIEYGYGARERPDAVDSYDRKDVWGHRRVSR